MTRARLKYITQYQKGKVPKAFSEDASLFPYLSMEYLRGKADVIQYVEPSEELKLVDENQILILWDGANAGEVMQSKKGYISSTMAVIEANENYFRKEYFYYFLKSKEGELRRASTGTTIPHLDQDFLFNTHFTFPPKPEQDAIVTHIKTQEEKIHRFIQKKQRFIELLKEQRQGIINAAVTKGIDANVKMKPSGVEWLGDVPEHWEVKRLKNLSKVISKGTTPSTVGADTTDEGPVRFLKAENLYENRLSPNPSFFIDEKTDEILFRSRLEVHDILIVIAGATLGRIGIVTKEFLPANTNQAICFIRPFDIIPEFMLMWMQSTYITTRIWLDATQSAQPNLAMGKIGAFKVLVPSYEEQEEILNHIKTETQTIDIAISKAEREIELIKEYKEAMVSEAVMGKSAIFAAQ